MNFTVKNKKPAALPLPSPSLPPVVCSHCPRLTETLCLPSVSHVIPLALYQILSLYLSTSSRHLIIYLHTSEKQN